MKCEETKMCVFLEMLYGLHGWIAGLAEALGVVLQNLSQDLTGASRKCLASFFCFLKR